jgi:tRNA(Met) cytidine acetyltransferase
MELAASLRAEAVRTNERRLLVLTGEHSRCRDRAADALAAIDVDPADAVYVGPEEPLPCRALDPQHADRLLGTTNEFVALDCHRRCEPNVIGQTVGTVDGGGLFVLLAPPLDEWPDRRDGFDETLAVPPFDRSAVRGGFRRRLVSTLRAHRGIAIVDVDGDATTRDADGDVLQRDGLVDPAPRLPRREVSIPDGTAFPAAAYEACLTTDQADALAEFERLRGPGEALVVEADRGRGKSSVAGLAAACLAREGQDVLVTAPGSRNAAELFDRALELLEECGALADCDSRETPRRLETDDGCVRFRRPAAAETLPGEPDRVIVDEAAALPVRRLESLLAAGNVAFTTTIHGYEGAGRGFSVRFRDRLSASEFVVTERTLTEPIRHAPGDPIEVWSFRALALGASPAPDQLVSGATPDAVTYRQLSPSDLLSDEHLLREAFGLLVLAHYRTEPNDLARLLDAPNVSVHALLSDGHVVSVALLAREGGLSADRRSRIYRGERIPGNLIPDLLASQLRDEAAGRPVGDRVMRIATHSAVRSRGLGSRLLGEIRDRASEESVDWLGVGFGATPELVAFWAANGYRAVHLGISQNDRSGEHSAIMLDGLSQAGRELCERHTRWFLRRFPGTLANALASINPDVVRAVCGAIHGTPPLDLTDLEWRILEGIPTGAAVYDTAPRPVSRLCFRSLVDGDGGLGDGEERLLVRKTLQAAPWDDVADELGYHSSSACMRALGEAIETLLARYGRATDRDQGGENRPPGDRTTEENGRDVGERNS